MLGWILVFLIVFVIFNMEKVIPFYENASQLLKSKLAVYEKKAKDLAESNALAEENKTQSVATETVQQTEPENNIAEENNTPTETITENTPNETPKEETPVEEGPVSLEPADSREDSIDNNSLEAAFTETTNNEENDKSLDDDFLSKYSKR